jgi:hypothetical protein
MRRVVIARDGMQYGRYVASLPAREQHPQLVQWAVDPSTLRAHQETDYVRYVTLRNWHMGYAGYAVHDFYQQLQAIPAHRVEVAR